MFNRKALSLWVLALLAFSTSSAAYQEVSCSTDPLFEQYSCNQCFNWGEQVVGSNIWFLNDKWVNNNDNAQILYKDEQDMPSMKSINETTWTQLPDAEKFWEYTEDLNQYYSEEEWGYILPWHESVSWLQSAEGYAYNLESTNAKKWDPVWVLVYSIAVHNIEGENDVQVEAIKHNECVLFTSWSEKTEPELPVTEEPKKLPQTGPEHILLLILAMILAFGVVKFTQRKS